ncbi:MAG TPA: hypothetical protein PLO28_13145 [bacterium]|nr:hypothetical protein [bacterium]
MRIFRIAAAIAIFFSSLGISSLQAQGEDEGIRVSASAQPNEVPLNRTAVVTIRLEWAGDLDRYEITRFDNPLVENLNIIETASANQVQVVGGMQVARQEYQYTVKPDGLGMAYVDGIIIRYADRETGKEYRLASSRLELKVIDPLPEPASYLWLVILLSMLLSSLIAVFLVRRIRARRAEAERLARIQAASEVSLEQKYGERLREEVDLRQPDLDVNAAFGRLAGVLRRYLAAKYSLPLISATTSEVRGLMAEAGADERVIADTLAVLESADIAKFSGAAQMRSELERAYTILERLLG